MTTKILYDIWIFRTVYIIILLYAHYRILTKRRRHIFVTYFIEIYSRIFFCADFYLVVCFDCFKYFHKFQRFPWHELEYETTTSE